MFGGGGAQFKMSFVFQGVLHYVIQSVLFSTWIFLYMHETRHRPAPVFFVVPYAAYLSSEFALCSALVGSQWVIQGDIGIKITACLAMLKKLKNQTETK